MFDALSLTTFCMQRDIEIVRCLLYQAQATQKFYKFTVGEIVLITNTSTYHRKFYIRLNKSIRPPPSGQIRSETRGGVECPPF